MLSDNSVVLLVDKIYMKEQADSKRASEVQDAIPHTVKKRGGETFKNAFILARCCMYL
jgi:hypothetical protein